MSQLFDEELPDFSGEPTVPCDVDSGIGSSAPSPLTLPEEIGRCSYPESPVSCFSSEDFSQTSPTSTEISDFRRDSVYQGRWEGGKHFSYANPIYSSIVKTKGLRHVKNEGLEWQVHSSRNFSTHQVILTEEPILIIPCRPRSSERLVCINCGTLIPSTTSPGDSGGNNLNVCVICKWPMCENGCDFLEGTDYKNLHSSLECSLICKSNIPWDGNPALYQFLWILRTAVMKRKNPIQFEQMLAFSKHMGIKSGRDYSTDEIERAFQELIPEVLTKKELQQIFRVLMCGFRPSHFDPPTQMQLRGLYLEASMIAHSCDPNLECWIDENYNQTLVAVRPIKEGEVLTLSFMDELVFLPTPQRRNRLLENFNFWCTCNRCEDLSEFYTNFSLPICRFSNECSFKQYNSETPVWNAEHYLHPARADTLRSDYVCIGCCQIAFKDKIIRWEIRFEDGMYRTRHDLYSLQKILYTAYRQKKIHLTHFLFFRGSWRLLELLSECLNRTEFLENKEYRNFAIPAESVHKIFKAFLPPGVSLAGRVLRTVSLIKLALLTDDVETDSLTLPEVQSRLEEVYFTKAISLENIIRYHQSALSNDMVVSFENDAFGWVEHYGIDKFVRTLENIYGRRAVSGSENFRLLVTYAFGNA